MCEFQVFLRSKQGEEKVAEEIVAARVVGPTLILNDVLGRSKRVEDAVIDTVDTGREVMTLKTAPLLAGTLRFLQLVEDCVNGREEARSAEEAWEIVRSTGEAMVRSLHEKHAN